MGHRPAAPTQTQYLDPLCRVDDERVVPCRVAGWRRCLAGITFLLTTRPLRHRCLRGSPLRWCSISTEAYHWSVYLPHDLMMTRLLVAVKAYPNPSITYGETVCVAGVTVDDPLGARWRRLYPLQYRDMESERQFRKWDVISLSTTPTRSDRRPESRRPLPDTIEIVRHIGTNAAGWAERLRLLENTSSVRIAPP
jgi:hypothetical protein